MSNPSAWVAEEPSPYGVASASAASVPVDSGSVVAAFLARLLRRRLLGRRLVAASASPTVSALAVSASTSSMTAIGALSPLRGPTLVMRV